MTNRAKETSELDLWNTKAVIDRLLEPESPEDAMRSTSSLGVDDRQGRAGYVTLIAPGTYMKGRGGNRGR
jgi:hypothetical protein